MLKQLPCDLIKNSDLQELKSGVSSLTRRTEYNDNIKKKISNLDVFYVEKIFNPTSSSIAQ